MNKQRMIKMIREAKEALSDNDLLSGTISPDGSLVVTEGTKALIGQLILASAIEEAGSSISLSLDKLDALALELGAISAAIAISD